MYHSDFDPYGKRKQQFKLFPEIRENPLVVAFQLFLIFCVIRVSMIIGGVMLFRVPYLDDLLIKLVMLIPRG